MDTAFTIMGTLITAVSFWYAISVSKKHSKLINYNREQAWDIYRQASAVLAGYQKLENLNIENREAAMLIARAEAHATELTLNSIKMIKRFENEFTTESIKKWAAEGKLDPHESHIQAFNRMVEI